MNLLCSLQIVILQWIVLASIFDSPILELRIEFHVDHFPVVSKIRSLLHTDCESKTNHFQLKTSLLEDSKEFVSLLRIAAEEIQIRFE